MQGRAIGAYRQIRTWQKIQPIVMSKKVESCQNPREEALAIMNLLPVVLDQELEPLGLNSFISHIAPLTRITCQLYNA